ncbi:MAG: putative toxin-antitoxin system toxin component, PIN family [Spirochaetes bacterium]|jgi:putative PIN family toxin of toxin-antitoxin system|nr:putative toxin-antitoxin system toxin component, PIN family [Spirochaetota bacterium]
MTIVLDTNVLVSGVLKPHSIPGSILNAILDERVAVLVDDRILSEYRDVLERPKFDFPPSYIESVLEFFEHRGDHVTAPPVSERLADPTDLPFYEVAIAGVADFLVTGNGRHFPDRHFVVSPKEFISILRGYE